MDDSKRNQRSDFQVPWNQTLHHNMAHYAGQGPPQHSPGHGSFVNINVQLTPPPTMPYIGSVQPSMGSMTHIPSQLYGPDGIPIERIRKIARTVMKHTSNTWLSRSAVEDDLCKYLPNIPEERWNEYCFSKFSMSQRTGIQPAPIVKNEQPDTSKPPPYSASYADSVYTGPSPVKQIAQYNSSSVPTQPSLFWSGPIKYKPHNQGDERLMQIDEGKQKQQQPSSPFTSPRRMVQEPWAARDELVHATTHNSTAEASVTHPRPVIAQKRSTWNAVNQPAIQQPSVAEPRVEEATQNSAGRVASAPNDVQQVPKHVDEAQRQIVEQLRDRTVANRTALSALANLELLSQRSQTGYIDALLPRQTNSNDTPRVPTIMPQASQAYTLQQLPRPMPMRAPMPIAVRTNDLPAVQQPRASINSVPNIAMASQHTMPQIGTVFKNTTRKMMSMALQPQQYRPRSSGKKASVLAQAVLLAAGKFERTRLNAPYARTICTEHRGDLRNFPFDKYDQPIEQLPTSTPASITSRWLQKAAKASRRGYLQDKTKQVITETLPTGKASSVLVSTLQASEMPRPSSIPSRISTAEEKPESRPIGSAEGQLSVPVNKTRPSSAAPSHTSDRPHSFTQPSERHIEPQKSDATRTFVPVQPGPLLVEGPLRDVPSELARYVVLRPIEVRIRTMPAREGIHFNANEEAGIAELNKVRDAKIKLEPRISSSPSRASQSADMEEHIGFPVYKCDWFKCGAELHDYATLIRHCDKVHGRPTQDGIWHCQWGSCMSATNLAFRTIDRWHDHMDEEHQQAIRYACPVKGCKQCFADPAELSNHSKKHVSLKRKRPDTADLEYSKNVTLRNIRALSQDSEAGQLRPRADELDILGDKVPLISGLRSAKQPSPQANELDISDTSLPLSRHQGWLESWDLVDHISFLPHRARELVPAAPRQRRTHAPPPSIPIVGPSATTSIGDLCISII